MKPPKMTQDIGKTSSTTDKKDNSNNDQHKNKEKREKNSPPTKVVIRRLPPSMTMETFLEQISPPPKYDYIYFVKGDMSLGQHSFSRAYINFVNQEDIFLFKEKFDDYVFVDHKGNEYPAVVEFAPFQKIPKKKVKKKDTKCGTIEQDPDYIKFLESLQNPEEVSLPSAEFYLEEIENKERELRANNGVLQASTPLIDYLRQKKAEKQRIREEKREERKRKENEKKRMKEEERRRRKAEKEREKERERFKDKAKEGKDKDKPLDDKSRREPSVKLLKNPEREKKESDKDSVERDMPREVPSTLDNAEQREKGATGLQRNTTSRDKEWDGATERRHREEDKFKQKEKLRDHRKERDKFKKDGKPYGRSNVDGVSDEYSRSTQAPRSSDWHRDRSERNVTKFGSSHVSSASSKTGGDKVIRGGKSYEKSRESIAKARNESRSGVGAKSVDTVPPHLSENLVDKPSDATTVVVAAAALNSENKPQMKSEGEDMHSSNDCDQSEYKKYKDRKGHSDGEGCPKGDIELLHDEKLDKEHVSRDPRSERRIRNKDRPSIELYRPGMRRLSLQRNSPQKDSPSSSSSPSPTAQMLGKHLRNDNNGSQQSSRLDNPACEQEVKNEAGSFVNSEDDIKDEVPIASCNKDKQTTSG